MKNLFCFIICLLSFSVTSFAQITHSEQFSLTDYTIKDTIGADQLTYSIIQTVNTGMTYKPGTPLLPMKPLKFIIPFGARIDSISLLTTGKVDINLQHLIYPVQQPVVADMLCPAPFFQEIDTSIYFSQIPFPVKIAVSAGYGLWNTANIASVEVYPFQYFPALNKLTFASEVNLVIHYSYPPGAVTTPTPIKMLTGYYSRFISGLSQSIVNNTDIGNFLSGIVEIEQLTTDSPLLPVHDYLVIVPGSFAASESLSEYVSWKKKRGIDIDVVSIEDVLAEYYDVDDAIGNGLNGNSYSISDEAASLRMYLSYAHSQGGANWILLLGDEDYLPVREIKPWVYLFGNRTPVSDKYFADFTSDYEVDGDGLYGELSTYNYSGDNVDLYPESCIGRIPCSNLEEAGIWIQKLLLYEQNPGKGNTDYLNHYVHLMADEMQNDINNNNIILENFDFFTTSVFQETPDVNNPTQFTGQEILNSLNTEPCGLWTWSTHGELSSLLTMTTGINTGNVLSTITTGHEEYGLFSLNNLNKPGIINSGSCHSAEYNHNTLCFAEAYLFNPAGGGVAFSGNTDIGLIEMEQSKLVALSNIFNLCHSGHFDPYTNIGSAENISSLLSVYNEHDSYLVHNLFADPEMRFYTKAPERISASHLQHGLAGNTISVTLNNIRFNDTVIACLFKPNGLGQGSDYQSSTIITGSNSQQTVSFSIPANLSSGKLFITVSGFNYLPYMGEMIITHDCTKSGADELIASNIVWQSEEPLFKNCNVVIQNGATLIIKGEVYFVPDAKIIVQQGGSLVVDGGLLSTSCEALWQGVEVWGNAAMPQYPAYQGSVEVKNNGAICDAICGIRTAKWTGFSYDATTTGGLFQCTNARFYNNRTGIKVHPYQYEMRNYNSNLSRSEFTLDARYLTPTAVPCFVKLEEVKGLGMSGNRFHCREKEFKALGVVAVNSGFRINQLCISKDNTLPCNLVIPGLFEGLEYGIHATYTQGAMPLVITENCIFTNNRCGIYLSAIHNANIMLNQFNMVPGAANPPNTGLYLNNCTGYLVQENTFVGNYSTGGVLTYETGIVINNSGTAPNEIYNNKFDRLTNGITAQDNNLGLVCKCNDYTGVKTDQSVLITAGSSNTIGIALYQGDSLSITGPAGNTFSPQHTYNGQPSDLTNNGARFKYYHHHQTQQGIPPRVKPDFYNNVTVRPTTYDYIKLTACPSKLGGGGINQEEIREQLETLNDSIIQKEAELFALVDGGNTEETTNDIVFSSLPESLTLLNDLIAKSPYLSDTVMIEAVNKENVLPNVMIRDILVANPQSATSDPVLDKLDERIDPMPEDLYNEILGGEAVVSAKEVKESEIASMKTKRAHLFNSLYSYYLADSTGVLEDSLAILLQNEPTPEAKYLLAFEQFNRGDTVNLYNNLNAIPSTYNLSPDQQVLYNDYLAYFDLLKNMTYNNSACQQPDSLQIELLNELIEQGHDPIRTYARNTLLTSGIITYSEPYLYPDELKTGRINKEHRMNSMNNAENLILSPNPCNHFVIVTYNFSEPIGDVYLDFTTIQGQVIEKINLNKKKDQFVLSLDGYSPGIIVASLKSGVKVIESKKVIIVK